MKAELVAWGTTVQTTTLAQQALLLARRLDGDPPDRELTGLSRELRLVLGELRGLAGRSESELDRFLTSIAVEEWSA
ncbi:MAG: hypothetical protein ACRDYV_06200 [Acidimicrobiia bacterium]